MLTFIEHTEMRFLAQVVQKLLPEQTLRSIHRHRQTWLNIDGWYKMQHPTSNGSAALLGTNQWVMSMAILEINFIGNWGEKLHWSSSQSFVDLFKTLQNLSDSRYITIHARIFPWWQDQQLVCCEIILLIYMLLQKIK